MTCSTIYQRILYLGRNSVTGRFFGHCGKWFDSCVEHSIILSYLGREELYQHGSESLTHRFFGGLYHRYRSAGKSLADRQNSIICSYVQEIAANPGRIPLPWLGSLLLPLAITAYEIMGPIACIAILLLSLLLMAVPCNIRDIIHYSRFMDLLIEKSSVDEDSAATAFSNIRHFYPVPFSFTLITAIIGLLWGPMCGIVIFAAVIGCAALLCYPVTGIALLLFLSPFFPTMLLVGLSLATFVCFFIAQLQKKPVNLTVDTTGTLVILFSILLLFYGLTSYTPVPSTKAALVKIAFILPFFLIYWLTNSEKTLRGLIFLFSLAAFGCGIIGLYQYLSGDVNTTWTDTELFTTLELRIYSTFENPNVYGEYLLLAVPLTGVMTFFAKKPLLKVFYGGTTLLLLLNLALTYSRGCYLALIFIFFLGVCWCARQLLIFVPFVLAATPFVMPDSILDRFASITNFSDHSTSYRLNIWLGTINMLECYWFLGIGLGQDAFELIYNDFMLNQVFAPHAHNLFLQVTTEMGIAGLLTLLAFLLSFIVIGHTSFKKQGSTFGRWLIPMMMAGVGGYLLEGMFDNVWYNYRVYLIFFMYLGLGAVACKIRRSKASH